MTRNPRVVQGYIAQVTGAIRSCRDGAYVQLDLRTAEAIEELLKQLKASLEGGKP